MTSVLQFLGGVVGWLASASGVLGVLPHGVQVVVSVASTVFAALGIRGATQTPSQAVVSWLDQLGSGWKTLAGILIWAVGTLGSDPAAAAFLSPAVAHTLATLGAVLAALGLYHATAKASTG